MTFFRLVRYVTQYHSDEFQDDTLKTSKKVILPFKSSQKIPEDNTLRGYPKIPGHFEKTKNFNKTLEFLVFFLYKKKSPKKEGEKSSSNTPPYCFQRWVQNTLLLLFSFSGLVTREEPIGAQVVFENRNAKNRCQVVPARSCTVYEKLLEGNAQQTGMDAPVAQVGWDDLKKKTGHGNREPIVADGFFWQKKISACENPGDFFLH